jgi:hypothetical protein
MQNCFSKVGIYLFVNKGRGWESSKVYSLIVMSQIYGTKIPQLQAVFTLAMFSAIWRALSHLIYLP